MADYSGASSIEKAAVDGSMLGATIELENQITRLESLISELDEKANRHIRPAPDLDNKIPSLSLPGELGDTDAAKRQWHNANDMRRLANHLESLVYRLDLL